MAAAGKVEIMKLSKCLIVAGVLLLTACHSEQTPSGSSGVSAGTTVAEAFTQRTSGRMSTAMRELLPAEQRKTRRALLLVKQRKKSRQEQALPGKELSIPAAMRKNQLY